MVLLLQQVMLLNLKPWHVPSVKVTPWFDDRRHSTVEQIVQQLEYREANKEKVAAFQLTTAALNFACSTAGSPEETGKARSALR